MKHVYLLQSIPHPEQRYVGLTSDLDARLAAHNAGQSSHTAKFRPWKLITSLTFADGDKAAEFEKYLKSGSGRAFANKRLWWLSSIPALRSSLITFFTFRHTCALERYLLRQSSLGYVGRVGAKHSLY